MPEIVVTCPACRHEFPLTETLAAPLIGQLRRDLEADAAARVTAAEERARVEEARRARAESATELEDLRRQAAEQQQRLAEARQTELALRQQARDLERQQQELELEVARRVDAETKKARAEAETKVLEERRLKEAEKDKVIADLMTQLDDLRRKAEQGSQQLQGEVQELDLEASLRRRFPQDVVEPVAKGQRGADCLQRVVGAPGAVAGAILWESKRTKAWGREWLPKLRADQRAAKAELAVLMSEVLPEGVTRFAQVDGVWVTDPASALLLAEALRVNLIAVAEARQAATGLRTKAELVYEYLAGMYFRQRVEAIVEAFDSMRADLDAERKALQKHWARREKQLEQVIRATTGLHGDLQAILGSALPEIAGFELRALGAGAGDDAE